MELDWGLHCGWWSIKERGGDHGVFVRCYDELIFHWKLHVSVTLPRGGPTKSLTGYYCRTLIFYVAL